MKTSFLLILAVLLFFNNPVFAQYYKYVDENGVVTFTDDPSQIPASQLKNLEVFNEIKNDETISPEKAPDQKQSSINQENLIDTARQDLQKIKRDLDQEYLLLKIERDKLMKESEKDLGPEEIKAYNARAAALNERTLDYETKKNDYLKKVRQYNSQVDQ